MAAKKITDILAKQTKKPERLLCQGYVPAELKLKVMNQMKVDKELGINTDWNCLIEAALLVYLSERES